MRQAKALFIERLNHYAPRLDVQWRKLSLSSAGTLWGTAHSDGSIRLNWRLVHFRLPVIDYVVAHELSHLRVMDHSPRFWETVKTVVPDYSELRGQLRTRRLPPGESRSAAGAGDQHARRETPDALRVLQPPHLPAMPQRMQVRHRLAHREGGLVQVQLALEQDRQHVARPTPAARGTPSITSSSRSRWCSCSWRMRACSPRNGLPCEGSTSVSSGSGRNLSIELEEQRAAGSPRAPSRTRSRWSRCAAAPCRR